MPHKHKRKRDGSDNNNYDLPPSKVAKPLNAYEKPVKKHHKGKAPKPTQQPQKRKRDATSDYKEDDTPRAFARLMQLTGGHKFASGLDDGTRKAKKKANAKEGTGKSDSAKKAVVAETGTEQLKILPGERLADFGARVNQAMPVGGLAKKGMSEGGKARQTKTEKRLHKMYAEWREVDAKRKERELEFQEEQEEKDEELQDKYGGQDIHLSSKKKRMLTEAADNEDPWAVLKSKREGPKGLHDVVQAPPEMKVIPKEKFKVKGGAKVDVANVPSQAGNVSLKRREELGEARKEVIERYRAMMKGKGGI